MKTVVIVTHGRSGSTLLQGVLNAIPGYCIRGENNNVMQLLHRFVTRLERAKRQHGADSDSPVHAWFGINAVNRAGLLPAVKSLFLEQVLKPPHDCIATGYKEIRYGARDMPDLAAHLAFVRQVFPDARFVFNVRNVEDTSRSSWWQNDPEAIPYLTDFQQRMSVAFEAHRDHAIWLRYEDVVSDLSTIRRLFDFLGDGVADSVVKEVLGTRHSVRSRVRGS